MARPLTRRMTLYRLPDVHATSEAMFEALDAVVLDEIEAEIQPIEIAGAPALWVGGKFRAEVATWCGHASTTTGLEISYGDIRSAGLLMIGVDGITYAFGYGDGHRLVPDAAKDQRFGLCFAIRRLNPAQIQDLVRRIPGARGRTDTTAIPAGSPVWVLGVAEHAEVVRRLGGRIRELPVTFAGGDNRAVRADGAVGLSMRFGVDAADLVADIREIARVCVDEAPHPELEFVEHIRPVSDTSILSALDAAFDNLLADDSAPGAMVPVVPTPLISDFNDASSFTIKIGTAPPRRFPALDLSGFLQRTRVQRPGERVSALLDGHVHMYAGDDGRDPLGGASAIKWLEVSLSIGPRRFFLLDGDWYEIDAGYLQTHRARVAQLLQGPPSLDLPEWDVAWTEGEYNAWVPPNRRGYVCLDRRGIRDQLHRRADVEICDLLAPADELVLVKRAHGSSPLSHLFSQGLVAAQTLLNSPEARAGFPAVVREYGDGRMLPEDFVPKKMVFAILLKDGAALTPDTLFPFSQVTLAHMAKTLAAQGIDVEVIGINSFPT